MSAAMIAALVGTASKLIEQAVVFLTKVFFIVAFLLLLSLILPADPFRSAIVSFSGTLSQWSDLINYFVPVRFILSTTFFYVVFRYFIYAYKILANEYLSIIASENFV